MSLSAHEEHALHSIEDQLSGSDPELASPLATFTRLTAGEDMPAREGIRAGWPTTRRSRRHRRPPLRDMARRLRPCVTWQGAGLVLALLLAFALLAGAVALAGAGRARACPLPGTTCAGQLPAHAAWLAGPLPVR